MSTLRKLLLLLSVLILVMSSSLAFAQDEEEEEMEEEPYCTEEIRDENLEAEVYIPLISKGFQHQFWQAVRLGAEQAAEDCGVEITFEGPESESQVDRQMEMLQTALDREPDAIAF